VVSICEHGYIRNRCPACNEARIQRRMVDRTLPRDWPRLAEAMGWTPEAAVPSWMDPDERAWFWHEVAAAARQAVVDREMEAFRAELTAAFSAPLLWLGRMLGRLRRPRKG